ncbi:unnamed protein product [Discula destructiva]
MSSCTPSACSTCGLGRVSTPRIYPMQQQQGEIHNSVQREQCETALGKRASRTDLEGPKLTTTGIRTLVAPRWHVSKIGLCDSIPHFIIHLAKIVWKVADVIAWDEAALARFCASFDKWSSFLQGAHGEGYESVEYPFCPPALVPGRFRILNIYDMKMWRGTWMIVLTIEVSAIAEELVSHVDISRCAIDWLRSRDWARGFVQDNMQN